MPERMIKQAEVGSSRAAMAAGSPGKRSLVDGIHASAQRGIATPGTSLPYRAQLQQLFGRHDLSAIQAHTGPEAAGSARAMGAGAYATGDHVVLGERADLHTVAHETAHVVQQRAGVALPGGVGTAGDAHERHADAVADRVVRGESAEALLDGYTGSGGGPAVQRMGKGGDADASEELLDHDALDPREVQTTNDVYERYDGVIQTITELGMDLAGVLAVPPGAAADDVEKGKEKGDGDDATRAVALAAQLVAHQERHVGGLRRDLAVLKADVRARRRVEHRSERATAKWVAAAALVVLAVVIAFFTLLVTLGEKDVWAGAGYGALAGLGMTMTLGAIAAIRTLRVPTTANKEDLKLEPAILDKVAAEIEARHKAYGEESVKRRADVTARFHLTPGEQPPVYARTRTRVPRDLEAGGASTAKLPDVGTSQPMPSVEDLDLPD